MTEARTTMIIGEWTFDVRAGTLAGPDGVHQMEDRAARTLALLCSRRGELIPQAEILQSVWNSRAVSTNSVAVVISDLRRALGDDSKAQIYITTVPKRGYRLNVESNANTVSDTAIFQSRTRAKLAPLISKLYRSLRLGLALGILALSIITYSRIDSPPPLRLVVEPVRNQTGLAKYQPTVQALSELLVKRMTQVPSVSVLLGDDATRNGMPRKSLILRSVLILWNGQPTLSLQASVARNGQVVWASMASGVGDALTQDTLNSLKAFSAHTKAVSEKL